MCLCARVGWVCDETISTSPASFDELLLFFHMCRSHSADFRIPLRGNCSVCTFRFGVSMKNEVSKLSCYCFELESASSLQSHRLQPTRLLCLWDCLCKNTGMDCHFLVQGLFPTQGSKFVSTEFAGEFFTTALPGKSQKMLQHPRNL